MTLTSLTLKVFVTTDEYSLTTTIFLQANKLAAKRKAHDDAQKAKKNKKARK